MRKTITIAVSILSALLIVWLFVSAKYPDGFWSVNFTEWVKIVVSLLIGYFVAYVLTEKNTKKRLLLEMLAETIDSIKSQLNNDCKQILEKFHSENWDIQLITSTKNLSNSLDLLTEYQNIFDIENEMSFIKIQYAEYRILVTECIDKLKTDTKSRELASLKIGLISNKLDFIKLKMIRQ